MKILFVLEYYHPYIGGSEQLFQSLAETLASKKHEVTILTSRFDSKLEKEDILNGVNIVRIPAKNRFSFTLLSFPFLIKYIPSFDIIHTTTYTAALPTWIACRLFQKKCFLTFHEYWNQLWFELPFLNFFERRMFHAFEKMIFLLPFHRIIAVSEFTKSALIQGGKKEKNIIHIYNGMNNIPSGNIQHQNPEKFTCTYFGRLGVSKGLDLLIPSIAQHILSYPESHFRLVIPQIPRKLYETIQSLIDEHDIRKHISIHHHLEKEALFQLLASSSCVTIPSYSEGFCFAAVESITLGVPILHSGRGALAETVSGRHIRMESFDVRGLTQALGKAYQNQWEQTAIRLFPLEEAVEAYIRLYESVIVAP